jgi:hypothetical protein
MIVSLIGEPPQYVVLAVQMVVAIPQTTSVLRMLQYGLKAEGRHWPPFAPSALHRKCIIS